MSRTWSLLMVVVALVACTGGGGTAPGSGTVLPAAAVTPGGAQTPTSTPASPTASPAPTATAPVYFSAIPCVSVNNSFPSINGTFALPVVGGVGGTFALPVVGGAPFVTRGCVGANPPTVFVSTVIPQFLALVNGTVLVFFELQTLPVPVTFPGIAAGFTVIVPSNLNIAAPGTAFFIAGCDAANCNFLPVSRSIPFVGGPMVVVGQTLSFGNPQPHRLRRRHPRRSCPPVIRSCSSSTRARSRRRISRSGWHAACPDPHRPARHVVQEAQLQPCVSGASGEGRYRRALPRSASRLSRLPHWRAALTWRRKLARKRHYPETMRRSYGKPSPAVPIAELARKAGVHETRSTSARRRNTGRSARPRSAR